MKEAELIFNCSFAKTPLALLQEHISLFPIQLLAYLDSAAVPAMNSRATGTTEELKKER